MKAVTRHMGIPVLAATPMSPMRDTHIATISRAPLAMTPALRMSASYAWEGQRAFQLKQRPARFCIPLEMELIGVPSLHPQVRREGENSCYYEIESLVSVCVWFCAAPGRRSVSTVVLCAKQVPVSRRHPVKLGYTSEEGYWTAWCMQNTRSHAPALRRGQCLTRPLSCLIKPLFEMFRNAFGSRLMPLCWWCTFNLKIVWMV